MKSFQIGAARLGAALFGNVGPGGETLKQIYGDQRLNYLRQVTCLYPCVVSSRNIDDCLPDLENLEIIFSTWGMFPLTDEQLNHMPRLRAVFYAAGSIRYFAPPLLERGITVRNIV